jgi:hypothetical protein
MFVWMKRHLGWGLLLATHLGMAAMLYHFVPPLPDWTVTVPKGSYGGEVYFVDDNARVLLANSCNHRIGNYPIFTGRRARPYCEVWQSGPPKTWLQPLLSVDSNPRTTEKKLKPFELRDVKSGTLAATFPEAEIWSTRFFSPDRRSALAQVEESDLKWRLMHPGWPEPAAWHHFDFHAGKATPIENTAHRQRSLCIREAKTARVSLDRSVDEVALVDIASKATVARAKRKSPMSLTPDFSEFSDDGRYFVECWQPQMENVARRFMSIATSTERSIEIATWPDARVVAFCPKRNVVFLLEKKGEIETAFLHDLDANERRGGWDRVDSETCIFSPDGRWLVLNPTAMLNGDGKHLRVIDVATGRVNGPVPIEVGAIFGFAGETLIVAEGKSGQRFSGFDLATLRRTWTHESNNGALYRWVKTEDGSSLIEHVLDNNHLEFRDSASGEVRGRAVCPASEIGLYHVIGQHLLATFKRDERNPNWLEKARRWLAKRMNLDDEKKTQYVAVYDAIHGEELARVPVSGTAEPHLSDDGRWLVCLDERDGDETMSCWSVRPARPWRWIVGVPAASLTGCLALRGAWRRWRSWRATTRTSVAAA